MTVSRLALSLAATFAAATCASASERRDVPIESLFPELRKVEAVERSIALYYPPEAGEVLKGEHPDARKQEEIGVAGLERPLRVRLNGDAQWFTIDCDAGPSADFSCTFLKETPSGLTPVGSAGGERFVFAGNGNIYVDGRNNRMYNTRTKLSWDGHEFRVIPQPFQYVGLESRTLRVLDIYSDKQHREVVARLPAGSDITVLLNDIVDLGGGEYDADHYLVATPFGLTGWIEIPGDAPPTIEYVYFHGD